MFDDVASAYITHDYVLDGSKILSETVTDNAYYNSYTLYYIYDASGSITGLHYNGAPYYFQKSIQGDVLRICNASGAVVVEYTYDAWGNILSVTGSMASTLGQYNSFRYRGYYYDSETDLYYLNSRYYDAEVGRFINADSYVSTGQGILGFNMFAYCLNNPVVYLDDSGAFAKKKVCLDGFEFDGNTISCEIDYPTMYGKIILSVEIEFKKIEDMATIINDCIVVMDGSSIIIELPGEHEVSFSYEDYKIDDISSSIWNSEDVKISYVWPFGSKATFKSDDIDITVKVKYKFNVIKFISSKIDDVSLCVPAGGSGGAYGGGSLYSKNILASKTCGILVYF